MAFAEKALAPQDARTIKNKNKTKSGQQSAAHSGGLLKTREMSLPQSGTTRAIYHPYCWVGGSPEMELTLRKRESLMGCLLGCPGTRAWEGQVEMGECEGDEVQTVQREHRPK